MPKTLFDRIWESHVVRQEPDGPALLYVDLHLIHEVTSAQAFEGLRLAGRRVRRTDLSIATMDHNVPTDTVEITDPLARTQLEALRANCAEFDVPLYATGSGREGIVHVIGPELGLTQPGMTIVCGDSHTSTHGAFGALAFGVGTSEVEHVLATQSLPRPRPRTMRIRYTGKLPRGLTPKDVILGTIGRIGVDGAVGHVVEYAGEPIEQLSMEGRLTVCNMSIEAGARAGMVAPDDTTFAYLEGRPAAPKGADWEAALDRWRALRTDDDAVFDREVEIDVSELEPQVTWGTNPGMVAPVGASVPDPASLADDDERAATERALTYMGLEPGTPLQDIRIDRVFIGSCTNGRIEDFREVAKVVAGKRVAIRNIRRDIMNELKELRTSLQKTVIVAPVSGIVIDPVVVKVVEAHDAPTPDLAAQQIARHLDRALDRGGAVDTRALGDLVEAQIAGGVLDALGKADETSVMGHAPVRVVEDQDHTGEAHVLDAQLQHGVQELVDVEGRGDGRSRLVQARQLADLLPNGSDLGGDGLIALVQRPRHVVEDVGQLSDLIPGRRPHGGGEVAFGDATGKRGQAFQRGHDAAGQGGGGQDAEQNDDAGQQGDVPDDAP